MFLIVTDLVNKQQNEDILSICQRADLEHEHVFLKKDNGKLSFFIGDQLIENCLKKEQKLFSFGSYNLALYLKNKGFKYGHNLDNLDQKTQMLHWGKENFLNEDHKIILNNEIEYFQGNRFFRPLNDSKNFNAGSYSYHEINSLVSKELLLMSSIKKINEEYRFVIINGKISSHSSYRFYNKVNFVNKANNKLHQFVNKILENWLPTSNFIIDIAVVNEGYKIIEVNNLHCSRFYGCSLFKIIDDCLNN